MSAHPKCTDGHICQEPSGRTCIEAGCDEWHLNWQHYLSQFGLALSPSGPPDGPIWYSSPWIATVKSLNYDGVLHAILLHQGSVVYHDPSIKKRYRTGSRIDPFDGTVQSGRHLVVTDASRLQHLADYQQWLHVNATTDRGAG